MDEKLCTVCDSLKPVDEFSIRKDSKDGLRNQCKQCVCDRQHVYAKTDAGRAVLKRGKAKYLKTEKGKESMERGQKKYRRSEHGIARAKAYNAIHNKTDAVKKRRAELANTEHGRLKGAAKDAVYYAVKTGVLIRPDNCERCKRICKPSGHHDDHNKKLDVMWLCPVCHSARHKEIGVI